MLKRVCFKLVRNPKTKNKLKRLAATIKRVAPPVYNALFYRFKNYARNAIYQEGYLKTEGVNVNRNSWQVKTAAVMQLQPLVSIIVPNYNHAPYLVERLDSIYQQTYKNFEVILLDDGSNDESVAILQKYKDKYSENTTLCVNEQNSGGVFKQWNKGISLAKGQYIWIAESDDYCELNFLEKLVPLFADEAVMLAFCRSTFMQNGKAIYTTEEYLQELDGFDWNSSFAVTAHDVVRNAWALKNIVPNVSSTLFRNIGKFPCEIEELWQELKLCGDWVFYLSLIKGGVVAYTNEVTNYYRVHAESTSLRIQNTPTYYQEYEMIARYIVRNYNVPWQMFEKQQQVLKEHYLCFHADAERADVDKWYSLETIKQEAARKKPNILIGGFSMIMGGGETFPIILANALKETGSAVTFFDFEMAGYDQKVRDMLRADIPLVKVCSLASLAEAVRQLGIEVVHSHHGCVDEVLSLLLLNSDLTYKQVITLHGMYEAIEKPDLERLLSNVSKTCSQFVYTAEKNLAVFKGRTDIDYHQFVKIRNGLMKEVFSPIDRQVLGISEEAFVLCLVSRGIPEKGWQEAVDAVALARTKSKLDIQLILIGDGEMYDLIAKDCPEFVHLQGIRSNIRDYFAASDMGFLPSRFKGESFPLVIIDSLFAGKPVIASNIGEVKYQLTTEDGKIAGGLFELKDWSIPIETLADLIVLYAKRGIEYEQALQAVEAASKKFDINEIAGKYLNIYTNAVEHKE